MRLIIYFVFITLVYTSKAEVNFTDSAFTVTSEKGIIYGNNANFKGEKSDLLMDIYFPKTEKVFLKPLIITIHGGSFMGGKKQDPRNTIICTYFAERGYLTASIDYRTGFDLKNPNKQSEVISSVLRSVQDVKAAIRFFRKNAEKYGIDTSKIVLAGLSAGSIAALHAAYLHSDELPKSVDTSAIGGIEGNSGNPGWSSYFHAVINCWGAIGDTLWITKGSQPVISFHGNKDFMVPIDTGMVFNITRVFGSKAINERAKNQGIDSEFYPFDGGHGLKLERFDFALTKSRDFLRRVLFKEQFKK